MSLLADSEDPDQTARMRSLIRTFAVRICLMHVFAWRDPNGKVVSLLQLFFVSNDRFLQMLRFTLALFIPHSFVSVAFHE